MDRLDDFRHLAWFRDRLAPESFIGVVLNTGSDIAYFGERLFAVPMSILF